MKSSFHIIFLIIFMIIKTETQAQQLSLDDCIQSALENNQQLENSRLEVMATDYKIKQTKGMLMPTVNAVGQYQYYLEVPSQYVPASTFGGAEGEFRKLSLNLPQTTSAQLQVTQNLFNKNVLTGLEAAKVLKNANNIQLTLTKENLVYNVSSTYFTVQVLQDNLKRLQENINSFEETVRINKVLKDNEIVAPSVHKRLLINLENLKNQYQNQKLLLDKNVTLLKYLIQKPISDSIQVSQIDQDFISNPSMDADINKRLDVQFQMEQIKMARLDKKSVLSQYYPVLQANLSAGYTGYYNEFSPFKQINNDWLSSSSFSLSLKIPIFDGFDKMYQTKQKEISIRQNTNSLTMLKSNAEKEVLDAWNNYNVNKELFEGNKKNLDAATELFKSSETEYANGIISLSDLLNAQTDLTNARTNYSTALINLKIAGLSLKKAKGEMLAQ
jgi:outer membrane protein